ncbi:hypothetical protein BGW39_003401 [Mortierella sp. 14UC]|nr:hypothetical protein BGW39_003401 [Mortierella sp. 14UC]
MHILSTNKLATVAMLATMSALSWTNTASANIEFVKTTLPNVNPGDQMTLNWNMIPTPPAGTVINVQPFNLVLRALTGQRYLIQGNVRQELLTLRVTVPSNATGGLHSYLCDYTGNDGLKGVSTGQFTISGASVTTTTVTRPATTTSGPVTVPTTSGTSSTDGENKSEGEGGLSSGALGGIIGGVVALFLFFAAIFFFRHRRIVRERNDHTRLDDTKESIHEPQGSSARSGPPSGPPGHGHGGHGEHDGGMVSVPLGGPRSNELQRNHSNEFESPRSQHQMQHLGGSPGPNNNNGKNPFEGPEETMVMGPNGPMARSLSPRDQHQPYQPPQLNQQPLRQQPPPYGMPPSHPGMQQQRNQSPFQQSNRDSFESELESAYDPNQARMMNNSNNFGGNGPIQRNNSNAMMHGGPLSHSASSRSLNSNGPRQNMSPSSPHLQQQPGNPFQDRELMAATAASMAVAGAAGHQSNGSPSMAHRQLQSNQQMSPRSQSPMIRAIEMQPLDVQQHQYEQQQRALQRQQQQQQQQQKQQQALSPVQPLQVQHQAVPPPQATVASTSAPPPAPVPSAPGPAPGAHPFNPTLYDDKTEIDDDGAPVYNGYRDTIFGAYVHTPGDDDDDDESGSDNDNTPVPAVPTSAMTQAQTQQKQQNEAGPAGGAGIERKKSVKFTGVPPSGPIVVPGVAQQQQQPQPQQQKPQQQMYHSGEDDDEDDEDYEYGDADEEDIKLRLMETEVPSPSSTHSRPMINTMSSPSASHSAPRIPTAATGTPLSPIRSPTQAYNSPSSHYQQQQQQSDNFFDDVLAAVDNKSSQSQSQSQAPYVKAAMPSVPPAPSSLSSQQQHDIQQQHISPQQPQQLKPLHVEQAVYGAPSPRISPATGNSSSSSHPSPPARSGARLPVGQQQHHQDQHQQRRGGADDEEAAFYESSLL